MLGVGSNIAVLLGCSKSSRQCNLTYLRTYLLTVHQGRGEVAAGQQYHVRIDQLDISFETYESHVLVTDCQLRSTWRVDA